MSGEEAHAACKAKIKALEQTIETLELEKNAAVQRKNKVQEELSQLNGAYYDAQTELKRLKSTPAAAWERTVRGLEKEKKAYEVQVRELIEKVKQAAEEKKQAEKELQEVNKYKADAEKANSAYGELRKDCDQAEHRARAAEEEKERLQKEVNELKARETAGGQDAHDLEAARASRAEAEKERDEARSVLQEEIKQRESVEADLGKAKQTLADIGDVATNEGGALCRPTSEPRNFISYFKSMIQTKEDYAADAKKWQDSYDRSEQEVASLKVRIEAAEGEASELRGGAAEAEKEKDAARKKIQDLEHKVAALTVDRADLEGRLKRAQQQGGPTQQQQTITTAQEQRALDLMTEVKTQAEGLAGGGAIASSKTRFDLKQKVARWDRKNDQVCFEEANKVAGTPLEATLNGLGERVGAYLAMVRRWAQGSPVRDDGHCLHQAGQGGPAPAPQVQQPLRPQNLSSIMVQHPAGTQPQQRALDGIPASEETKAYYDALPEPWNKFPDGEPLTEGKLMKLLGCTLVRDFNGRLEEYLPFRTEFIANFHRRPGDPALKYAALKKFTKGPYDRVTQKLAGDAKSYALLIKKLENEFGGQERIVSFYLTALRKCKVVQSGALKDMEDLVMTVEALHQGYPDSRATEINSLQHIKEVMDKLSTELVLQYRQHCTDKGASEHDIHRLIGWLQEYQIKNLQKERHRARTDTRSGHGQANAAPTAARKAATLAGSVFATSVSASKAKPKAVCPDCDGQHRLEDCQEFLKKHVNARRAFVYGSGRCLRCLGKGHKSKDCTEPKCSECGRGHHKILHGSKNRIYVTMEEENGDSDRYSSAEEDELGLYAATEADPETPGENAFIMHTDLPEEPVAAEEAFAAAAGLDQADRPSRKRECSLRFVVLRIRNPDNNQKTLVNALVDGGASITALSERAAKEVGLTGPTRQISIKGFGGTAANVKAQHCRVAMENRDGRERQVGVVAVMKDPASGLRAVDWTNHRKRWPHLEGIKLHTPLGDGRVDMILGTDWNYYQRALEERYPDEDEGPVATRSHLGWTVAGPLRPIRDTTEFIHTAYAYRCSWEYSHPPPPVVNAGNRAALDIIANSTRRLPDGRLEVAPLWKGEARPPPNFKYALRDWNRVEARLEADPKQRKSYDEALMKMEKKGFLEEIGSSDTDGFFLTHFPVIKDSSTTTKVRVVMNGAADHAGSSLNDYMHSGPKTLNSLVQALMRFRRGRWAIIADVEAMFLNICLPKEDRKYHRIVYRKLGEQKVRIYENCGQVFGSTGSPCISVATVKLAAMHLRHMWPDAAAVVLNSSIVDDNLGSCDSQEELALLVQGLVAIYDSCGMTLHKWASNKPEALPEGVAPQRTVEIKDGGADLKEAQHKPLGVYWDSTEDVFTFAYTPTWQGQLTKLKVLQIYMGLFDPLGFLLPVVMEARMLYRALWDKNTAWDDELSEADARAWRRWFDSLRLLPDVRLKRHTPAGNSDSYIAVFCDASVEAYGACAYLVSQESAALLYARGRINSSAAKTIPKLELMAAQMGVQVGHECARALERSPDSVYYFTDSMNTLVWIRNPGRHVEAFVLRKAHQIRETSEPRNWNFVPTDKNPADLISRGVKLEALLVSDLWCAGPDFLLDKDRWPKHGVPAAPHLPLFREEEMTQLIGIYSTSLGEKKAKPLPSVRASSFRRAVRAAAMAAAAFHIWKQRVFKLQGCAPELWRAWARNADQSTLWAMEQAEAWLPERLLLLSGKELPAQHAWRGFSVALQGGVMVATGRLNSKPKPILHPKSQVVALYARHIHEVVLKHAGGQRTLLAELKEVVQLQGAKVLAKRTLRTCVRCQRLQPRPEHQQEGPLPLFRQGGEENQGPFTHIIIDEFGPIETKAGRGKPRHKRWVLVFSCGATRAVHMELLASREAAEVATALTRFAARRGVPVQVHSDNAKEFHAVAEALKGREAPAFYNAHGWHSVKWTFSPPMAPHWGGAVEATVKLAKNALKAIGAHDEPLTDLEYSSALVAAEEIINRRPLGEIEDEVITPAHFILGRKQGTATIDLRSCTNTSRAWENIKRHHRDLWERLQREVVPLLQERKKWRRERPSLKEGQLVLVKDIQATAGPFQWALGRVERAHQGRDGKIRSYSVRVAQKEYTRAITSLAPLLLPEQQE